MDSIAYTPLTQGPGCSKCGSPRKGHPLPYSMNWMIAHIGESTNDSTDTLSCSEEVLEVPHLHSQSLQGKPEYLVAESAASELVDQGPWILAPAVPTTMVLTAANTIIITTGSIPSGVLMECALGVSSTRLGQQGKERAKDRCCIKELSQQLTETSDQLAYIRKVLDHLYCGQTPAPTAAMVTAASRLAPSSGSGCFPPGQAASLPGTGLPPTSQASLFIAQPSAA